MRALAGAGLFLFLGCAAYAQDQERSLVNRLLKPDMTLANPAQNKKFSAVGESINKHASVASFYFENKSQSRTFRASRDFQSGEFDAKPFWDRKHKSAASDQKLNGLAAYSQASSAHPVGKAADHDKSAKSREYAGQRPFLEHGKSQKSLNRENPPMTIEQVRELLNRNK